MNNLINITNQNGNLVVSSREVASNFKKENKHVMEAIREIETSVENSTNLFIPSIYKDTYERDQNEYLLTRDGFSLLVMGFTGKKALEWKLKYIEVFNKMEESLKQAITMLTEEQKLQLAIFQAKTSNEAVQASANLDRYRQRQIEDKQKEIEYKNEVLRGVTEDIDIYTKRNKLNKVVKYKGANFKERWNELYDRFKEVYHVDLKARREGYNLKQAKKKDQLSIIKYAEQFGYLDNLYKVAVRLYETDVNEILEQLKQIA